MSRGLFGVMFLGALLSSGCLQFCSAQAVSAACRLRRSRSPNAYWCGLAARSHRLRSKTTWWPLRCPRSRRWAIPRMWSTAIYDVQAVVARTYAVTHLGRHRADGFDFCDSRRTASCTTSAQADVAVRLGCGSRGLADEWTNPDVRRARRLTRCFMRTAAADGRGRSAVWGGAPVAYLQAIVDDVPQGAHRAMAGSGRRR